MQTSSPTSISAALRALLSSIFDYAGIFPPAALALSSAVENYNAYATIPEAWMLRSFVLAANDVQRVPEWLDGKMAVLADRDEERAAAIESKTPFKAAHPVYCEVAIDADLGKRLDEVKSAGCFAKIRTGGVKPEAIPSPADVARFIRDCAQRRLPFKATAGLHHPIRAEHALTYEIDAPRAVMHGFLNVSMAAAFAWHFPEMDIEPVLAEIDPSAFKFSDDKATWRTHSLSTRQIQEARAQFFHSIGSCSFQEPIDDLRKLFLI